jgi:hypothetical protein
MSSRVGRIIMIASVAAFLMGGPSIGMARTRWQETHPRRVQVNHRLNNQNRRVRNKFRSGQMGVRKAARIHAEDRAIRNEERNMARRNGGRLTRRQQGRINRQENAVSRQIAR